MKASELKEIINFIKLHGERQGVTINSPIAELIEKMKLAGIVL